MDARLVREKRKAAAQGSPKAILFMRFVDELHLQDGNEQLANGIAYLEHRALITARSSEEDEGSNSARGVKRKYHVLCTEQERKEENGAKGEKEKERETESEIRGDPDAQCMLGIMYEEGLGVKGHMGKAFEFYGMAAEQGSHVGQCMMGVLNHNGEKGKFAPELPSSCLSITKALEYYQLAAAQGNPAALCNLGILYAHGRGVEKDRGKAARYYGASGAKGYLKGHYYLACLYLEGPGQHQQDDNNNQTQNNGNNTQQTADGAQPVPRDTGPPKDVRKALEILNIAAAKGYPDASYSIGWVYLYGEGHIQKDKPKALQHFLTAAEADEPTAQSILGWMYENGVGLPDKSPNIKAACEWYHRASEHQDDDALNALASFYLQGIGVCEDWARGYSLVHTGAKNHVEELEAWLAENPYHPA